MIPFARDIRTDSIARIGTQPIALAAATLLVILAGVAGITLWRTYSGTAQEPERAVVARQLQARTAQASEQLVEKTKGLEATQQESIDQLQMVQDQLQTAAILCQFPGVRALVPAGGTKPVSPDQSPRVPDRAPPSWEITQLSQIVGLITSPNPAN